MSEGRPGVDVIHSDGGSPKRLINDQAVEESSSWSRDGKWIYFSSNRAGDFQEWKTIGAIGARRRRNPDHQEGPLPCVRIPRWQVSLLFESE
ncbi:MAG: hypothetical protein DMG57_08045 [Acidobacteria bacterium]|nr:MAG: hypothetical protein DMG57_08045 [Acidobacteriota bacterium]